VAVTLGICKLSARPSIRARSKVRGFAARDKRPAKDDARLKADPWREPAAPSSAGAWAVAFPRNSRFSKIPPD